jgi:hypothetical protein
MSKETERTRRKYLLLLLPFILVSLAVLIFEPSQTGPRSLPEWIKALLGLGGGVMMWAGCIELAFTRASRTHLGLFGRSGFAQMTAGASIPLSFTFNSFSILILGFLVFVLVKVMQLITSRG